MGKSAAPKGVDQLLREGIQAAQAGNRSVARDRLKEVVAQDESNEKGWLWLASVVETDDEKRVCLSNVLVINPNNERAKSQLEALDRLSRQADKAPGEVAPGVNRRMLFLLGLLGVLVIILLVALVNVIGKGSGETPTSVAVQPTIAAIGTAEATQAATKAATQSATSAAVIVPAVRNTLPPSWTPLPTITSALLPTGTPLAAPPAGLKGHIIGLSGQPLTLEGFLPVVIMNPDGSDFKMVPTDPERAEYAILLPDGQHLVYTYNTSGTDSKLMRIANINGTQPREVKDSWGGLPALDKQRMITVSANGKFLAFAAQSIIENDPYSQVYVLDTSRLLGAETGDQPPATVAATAIPVKAATRSAVPTATPLPGPPTGTPSLADIYLMRVTPKNSGDNDWPAISSDGKSVAFVTDTTKLGKDGIDLYIAPVRKDSKSTNLTNDGAAFTEGAPSWSPDGKQIAFMAAPQGSQYNDIVLINADGSNRQTLVHTEKSSNIRPHWSPDGKYIAFSSNRGGVMDIYILEVATKTTYQVTHNGKTTIATSWGP